MQPDVTPIPDNLPATEFNQGQLLETLFDVDDDGQMMLRYANGSLPTYKAGGRSADALIEEIRQRFGWAELDGAAKKASDEAMYQKNGWNKLTWDEKKQLFSESRGLYRSTPQGRSLKLICPAQRSLRKTLEWTPEGNISAEEAAVVKPKPEPKKRRKKSTTSTQVRKARDIEAKADEEVAALEKQLERATCNG